MYFVLQNICHIGDKYDDEFCTKFGATRCYEPQVTFYQTSVDEIVRGANVAKGTFYLYFHDKDQLLGQLVYNISAQVLEEAYEWLDERRTPDFVENVLLLLDYVVEYFKRNKLVLRLVERNFSWPMVAKQMSERHIPQLQCPRHAECGAARKSGV